MMNCDARNDRRSDQVTKKTRGQASEWTIKKKKNRNGDISRIAHQLELQGQRLQIGARKNLVAVEPQRGDSGWVRQKMAQEKEGKALHEKKLKRNH
jgi:hypothetical protein